MVWSRAGGSREGSAGGCSVSAPSPVAAERLQCGERSCVYVVLDFEFK